MTTRIGVSQKHGKGLRAERLWAVLAALIFGGVLCGYGQEGSENPHPAEKGSVSPSTAGPAFHAEAAGKSYRTFYLVNPQAPEANDIQTDLRNMLPKSNVSYVPAQGALSVRGTPEDIEIAGKILSEIDLPKKSLAPDLYPGRGGCG